LSTEEKWCIYFRYAQDEEKAGFIKELCQGEEGIMQAEKILKKVSREEEEWARALFREKMEMDYRSGMHASHRKGYQEGIQAAEQRAELALARRMKAHGRPLAQIVEDTGLSPEEIENL
jgi:predicted transposase/invertase (TIGR01784 family)